MSAAEGVAPEAFRVSAGVYDEVMGRYSAPLAGLFADFIGPVAGARVLDVGCGPGALTRVLVECLGPDAVSACDPSPGFVAACAERNPGVTVRLGAAEALPFDDGAFGVVAAQLVMHFVSDVDAATAELLRVAVPGATVAACVWDFGPAMQFVHAVAAAAQSVDPQPPEQAPQRFGTRGELAQWLQDAGLRDVTEAPLTVQSHYRDFAELWSGLTAASGTPGRLQAVLAGADRQALRDALFAQVGSPSGAFDLSALAWAARGVVAR